jgi:hypothetical protein
MMSTDICEAGIGGGLSKSSPTIGERLQRRKESLLEDLAVVESAQKIIETNPQMAEFLDLVQKARV